MVPEVGAMPLPVIVLFPRDSTVSEPPRETPKVPLFANTQFE